jgi:hypothetical protein
MGAAAPFGSHPHRRCLADAEWHHEGDAGVVDCDLMGCQRLDPEQSDHRGGYDEDADLQGLQPSDWSAQAQDTAAIGSHRADLAT